MDGYIKTSVITSQQSGSKLSFQYLKDITNNFSDELKLGEGGFGVVYKGRHNGEMVAVRMLLQATPSSQEQLENELIVLMKLEHQNIVRLVGHCYKTEQKPTCHKGKSFLAWDTKILLCLEYLPNGNLQKHISDASSRLNWHERYKIIVGISYGLQYLHEYSNEPIIHLDLKPANILLDKNMHPKITDFGLSRLFAQNQTIHTIHASGTLGYMSQEVLRGVITPMADIFSLGVIIIEIIMGHRDYPYDITRYSKGFTELELQKWKSRIQKEAGYTSLETDCQKIEICIQIGLICVNLEPTRRPTIKKIIDMLEGNESMNWCISNEIGWNKTMDEYIKTGVVTSQKAEHAPDEQHLGMPNSPGETSLKMVECRSEILEESQIEIQKQVQVCAEVGIECIDFSPVNRPDTKHIIDRLGEIENMEEYYTDMINKYQNEQAYELKQLRDQNNLQSLKIDGLENVTSMEEALEANLAKKEGLTKLELRWNPDGIRCSPEAEAEVLEGLCPPVGLKKLHISCYKGSRYPDWMVGKQNGGPKDLEEFDLHTFVKGPAPQIVEAFPHLRVLTLWGGDWDALPSNMEHLTSLKRLEICSNENIRSLPTLPRSLEEFDASHCHRKFMKFFQKVGHPNWQKIQHIPKKTFGEYTLVAEVMVEGLKLGWELMKNSRAFQAIGL